MALLESKQDKAAGGDESKSGGDDPDEDDIEVPDLSEDDGYDPGLVKAFAALKATRPRRQSETIKSLKAGGESLGAKNWLDSKVAALGDEFKDALGVGEKTVTDDQAETRTKVKAKFDVPHRQGTSPRRSTFRKTKCSRRR